MVLHVLSYKEIADREMAPTPRRPARREGDRGAGRGLHQSVSDDDRRDRRPRGRDDGGDLDPSAGQALAQPLAGPRQSAPHRVLGHAEAGRRGLVRHRLQVAEDDRRPVGLGEPGDLLGEDRPGLGPGMIRHDLARRAAGLRESTLVPAATGGVGPRPGRDAMRDAVQPARERVLHPERPGLPGQHEEGGLEGVLGGMLVAEHAPADAEDHRPVPLHQGLEGQLGAVLVAGGEPRQELGIGQPGECAQVPQPMNLPEQPGPSARHVRSLPPGNSSCFPVMPGSGVASRIF